ncbi:hypothetical protein [Streptacidiphilus cavernicola]|uniref:Uncharacterized protein n=1 Tax=Streptacidiphilus cavernicola TaxID=3342716 RepID=A0ABV6VY48_9ACTN
MSEAPAVPEGSSLLSPEPAAAPAPAPHAAPQDLLAQMQQMLAALNADLLQLDADLRVPPPRTESP